MANETRTPRTGVRTKSELARQAASAIAPVHQSLRRGYPNAPNNMSRLSLDHAEADLATRLALSIFTDCVNAGTPFQDAILAVYLSGLHHGVEAQKERMQ